MYINFKPSGGPQQSLAARIVGAVVAVIVFGLALMFSAVVFVVLAIAALGFWIYFWWKTRALRRALQEQGQAGGFDTPAGAGDRPSSNAGASNAPEIIEGESVRIDEDHETPQR